MSIFNDDITPQAKDRSGSERPSDQPFLANGEISIGIDPGSRFTAIVIIDGEEVLHATTIKREGDQEPVPYARHVVNILRPIIAQYLTKYPQATIGIEGISDPKGFNRGARAAINPKDIIRTGVTAGALAIAFPDAVIVPPGRNGSLHISHYPPSLKGRRDPNLPGDSKGAGTRRHEQSAYDIAKKARLNNGNNE